MKGLFFIKVVTVLLMILFIKLDSKTIMCTNNKVCVCSVLPLPMRGF